MASAEGREKGAYPSQVHHLTDEGRPSHKPKEKVLGTSRGSKAMVDREGPWEAASSGIGFAGGRRHLLTEVATLDRTRHIENETLHSRMWTWCRGVGECWGRPQNGEGRGSFIDGRFDRSEAKRRVAPSGQRQTRTGGALPQRATPNPTGRCSSGAQPDYAKPSPLHQDQNYFLVLYFLVL